METFAENLDGWLKKHKAQASWCHIFAESLSIAAPEGRAGEYGWNPAFYPLANSSVEVAQPRLTVSVIETGWSAQKIW